MDVKQIKDQINNKLMQKEANFILSRKQDILETNRMSKDIWHCFNGFYQPEYPHESLLPQAELITPVLEQEKVTRLNMYFQNDCIAVNYSFTYKTFDDPQKEESIRQYLAIKDGSFGESYWDYRAYTYHTINPLKFTILKEIHNNRYEILAKIAKDLGVEDVNYGV